jgi:hypothetical protein
MDESLMNISPPQRAAVSGDPAKPTAAAAHRSRGIVLTVGLLAVIATAAVAAAPAALASSPSPGTAKSSPPPSSRPQLAPPGEIRWSLTPASATAPILSETKFSYLNIRPGATVLDHVAVFNYSRQAEAFEIYGTDATGTTASNELLLMPATEQPTDIGAWVSFPHAARLSVIIPGDHGVIEPFTIDVPRDATPGDHTGGIVAAVSTEAVNHKGQELTTVSRIAIPLEMRVIGPLRAGMRVDTIWAGFANNVNPVGDGSATVTFVVQNTGNIRLAGTQRVTVTGPFGLKATIRPKLLATVLPGDSVEFTARAPGLYPAGPLTAHVVVSPAAPAGAPALAAPMSVIDGSVSLFAVPWAALVLLLVLIGAGIGSLQVLRYRERRLQEVVNTIADRVRRETEQKLLGKKGTSAGTPKGQS